jgi:hypothetical protein
MLDKERKQQNDAGDSKAEDQSEGAAANRQRHRCSQQDAAEDE